jgi:O-antigen/teichoic acid export membrane protein
MRAFLANVASLLMGNLFTQAVGIVFSLVMVQRMSNGDYALQSAVIAFTSIMMGLADLGLYDVATRELAGLDGDAQKAAYSTLLSLELALSASICLLGAVIAWLLNSFPGDQYGIFVLGLFTLVFSYAPIVPTEALMATRGRVRQIAIFQSIYAFCAALFGTLILLSGGGVAPLYIMLSVLSLALIVLYFREMHYLIPGSIRFTINVPDWKRYLGQSIPTGLGSALQMSAMRLGTYLSYTFANKADTSYLGVSYLIVVGVTSLVWVPYAINITPIMVRLYSRSREQLIWLSGRSMVLLLAVTLPTALGTTLLAPEILAIVSPNQMGAVPTLRIFIWVLPVVVWASFLYRLLLIMDRSRLYMVIAALGAAISLVCCVLLIPGYGSSGAALSAVIGMAVIALLQAWVLRIWILPGVRLLDGLRVMAALSGMALIVVATPDLWVFVRIVFGALTYGAILLLTGIISSSDRQTTTLLLKTVQDNVPA